MINRSTVRVFRSLTWFVVSLITIATSASLFGYQDHAEADKLNIRISAETTFITEPLTEDGLPDYRKWILERQRARARQHNGQNGAIPFWQAMWPGTLDEKQQKLLRTELGEGMPNAPGPLAELAGHSRPILLDEITDWIMQEWSRDHDQVSSSKLVEMRQFANRYATNMYVDASSMPFKATERPPITDWIQRSDAGFHRMDMAASCEFFYLPYTSLLDTKQTLFFETGTSHENSLRHVHRSLAIRTNLLIGECEYQAAWKSASTQIRLANIACQEEFLASQNLTISCANYAYAVIQNLTFRDDVPLNLLWEIFRELENSSPNIDLAQGIQIDLRFCLLDMIIHWSQGRSTQQLDTFLFPETLKKQPPPDIDWNLLLVQMNGAIDEFVATAELPFSLRQGELENLNERWTELPIELPNLFPDSVLPRETRTLLIGNRLVSNCFPLFRTVFHGQDNVKTNFELTRIAVALAIHRSQHGEYPESLAELVPAIVDAIPTDHFQGKPLLYRRTSNGFLLYSAGPNGIDDQADMDSYKFLRGYRIIPENFDQLKQWLNNEIDLPENIQDLYSQIKKGADDIAIRYPQPILPLPECPAELKAEP